MKKRNVIIIVVIVAAVAAFLVWRKSAGKKFDELGAGSPDIEPAGSSLTETQIIDRLTTCPESHKKYLRQYCAYFNTDPTSKAQIQQKASDGNYTFAKQAVMDAAWIVYCTGDNANQLWANNLFKQICAEVKAM